jgi:uncharacterized protein (DUF427 family)
MTKVINPRPESIQPGQESVWDYPRPPRLEPSPKHIQVWFNGLLLVDTRRALRMLETSHPPVYYIPPEDIRMEFVFPASGSSFCEWKGQAGYLDVQVGERLAPRAAWRYLEPTPPFRALAGYLAFYPALMDVCKVNGEIVRAQPGNFYGGWITSDIIGPFKGGPGTYEW